MQSCINKLLNWWEKKKKDLTWESSAFRSASSRSWFDSLFSQSNTCYSTVNMPVKFSGMLIVWVVQVACALATSAGRLRLNPAQSKRRRDCRSRKYLSWGETMWLFWAAWLTVCTEAGRGRRRAEEESRRNRAAWLVWESGCRSRLVLTTRLLSLLGNFIDRSWPKHLDYIPEVWAKNLLHLVSKYSLLVISE